MARVVDQPKKGVVLRWGHADPANDPCRGDACPTVAWAPGNKGLAYAILRSNLLTVLEEAGADLTTLRISVEKKE